MTNSGGPVSTVTLSEIAPISSEKFCSSLSCANHSFEIRGERFTLSSLQSRDELLHRPAVTFLISSTFILSCPFGELGLRPFTGQQGRRANAFTGGQGLCNEGRPERMARGLPLWVFSGEISALAETVVHVSNKRKKR